MLHPLFSLLIQRPELLAEHLAGYAALVQQDALAAASDLRWRAGAYLAAFLLLGAFALLGGVAVMLSFILDRFHWALVATPGAMLAGGIALLIAARNASPIQRFTEVKAQLEQDLGLLRAAGDRDG